MRAAVRSVWAVIVTIAFVQTANGLQTSLLGVRAGIESFPAWTFGLIMASYYVGYTAAPLASRRIIGRVGHVNTMTVGALFAAILIDDAIAAAGSSRFLTRPASSTERVGQLLMWNVIGRCGIGVGSHMVRL